MSSALRLFKRAKTSSKVQRTSSLDGPREGESKAKQLWKRSLTAVFGQKKAGKDALDKEEISSSFCRKHMLETLMQLSFMVCSSSVADCREAIWLISHEEAMHLFGISEKVLSALMTAKGGETSDAASQDIVSLFISQIKDDDMDDCWSPRYSNGVSTSTSSYKLRKRGSADSLVSAFSEASSMPGGMENTSPYTSEQNNCPGTMRSDEGTESSNSAWTAMATRELTVAQREQRRKLFRKSASDNSLASSSAKVEIKRRSSLRKSLSNVSIVQQCVESTSEEQLRKLYRKSVSDNSLVSSSDVLRLLQQRADNNTYERSGDLEWTMDGCPRAKDAGASKRSMVQALIRKHEKRNKAMTSSDRVEALGVIPASPQGGEGAMPMYGSAAMQSPQVMSPESSIGIRDFTQVQTQGSLLAFFVARVYADRESASQACMPRRASRRKRTDDSILTRTTENTAILLDRARFGMGNSYGSHMEERSLTQGTLEHGIESMQGVAFDFMEVSSSVSSEQLMVPQVFPRLKKQRSYELQGARISRNFSKEFAESVPEDLHGETCEALEDMADGFVSDEQSVAQASPAEDSAHTDWQKRRAEKKKQRTERGRATYGQMLRSGRCG